MNGNRYVETGTVNTGSVSSFVLFICEMLTLE